MSRETRWFGYDYQEPPPSGPIRRGCGGLFIVCIALATAIGMAQFLWTALRWIIQSLP